MANFQCCDSVSLVMWSNRPSQSFSPNFCRSIRISMLHLPPPVCTSRSRKSLCGYRKFSIVSPNLPIRPRSNKAQRLGLETFKLS